MTSYFRPRGALSASRLGTARPGSSRLPLRLLPPQRFPPAPSGATGSQELLQPSAAAGAPLPPGEEDEVRARWRDGQQRGSGCLRAAGEVYRRFLPPGQCTLPLRAVGLASPSSKGSSHHELLRGGRNRGDSDVPPPDLLPPWAGREDDVPLPEFLPAAAAAGGRHGQVRPRLQPVPLQPGGHARLPHPVLPAVLQEAPHLRVRLRDQEPEQENEADRQPNGAGLLEQNRPALEVHHLLRGLPDPGGDSRRGGHGLF